MTRTQVIFAHTWLLLWDNVVTARWHLHPECQTPMARWCCCIFLWDCSLLGSGAQLTSGSSQTKSQREVYTPCATGRLTK